MKFLGGFILGILTTIAVGFFLVAIEYSDQTGITQFPEDGECISKSNLEVFQTIEPDQALAMTADLELTVLVTNFEGKTYYDQQKIKVPRCARQIGTFQYEGENDRINTVPLVVIE